MWKSTVSKKNDKTNRTIIEQTYLRVLLRLANPKCLKAINHDGYDLSPTDALSTIFNRGDIKFNREMISSSVKTGLKLLAR